MKKNITIICLFILISVCLQFFLIGQALNGKILLGNTLDFSWQTDSIERLLHGYVAGRDFIFTYGPLFQLIYSLPAVLFQQPSYLSVVYAPLFLTVFNVIMLFSFILLATRQAKTTIILLGLLLFVVDLIAYDANSLFRLLFPFVYGMLLLRYVSLQKPRYLQTISILTLPSFFGMYTFDLFVLGVVITILFFVYKIIQLNNQSKEPTLKKHLLATFFSLFFVFFMIFLTSFLLSGNLSYLRYSYDTIQNYQLVMSLPWTVNKHLLLFLFPIGLIFTTIIVLRKTRMTRDLKTAFIMLTVIALLQLKAAIIRFDEGHIIMGIYPSLIILFIELYFLLREKLRIGFVVLFLLFFILIPFRNNYYASISVYNLKAALTAIISPQSFFFYYRLPDDYYYSDSDFQLFKKMSDEYPENLLIYPYDSYVLNISGNTYNTRALQFYQYAGSVVEETMVQELTEAPPRFILLGVDTKGAIMLDDIPNFTRNPLLAQWMITNYSVEKKTKNYLLLRFNPEKKTIKGENCSMYELDLSEQIKPSLLEEVTKPSLYYLKLDKSIRLPAYKDNTKFFISEDFINADRLEKIFIHGISKDGVKKKIKQLSISKKYFLPKLIQMTVDEFEVMCY